MATKEEIAEAIRQINAELPSIIKAAHIGRVDKSELHRGAFMVTCTCGWAVTNLSRRDADEMLKQHYIG